MYKDKVVLVSGSSRGVGLEITKHFLNHGASVIGLSRNKFVLDHPLYHHEEIDLLASDQIPELFRKRIRKKFNHIDIAINNAAVLTSQYALIMPLKNIRDMIEVNLLGTFLISRESARLMRKNDFGRIINISSMAVSLEPEGDSIYAATKSGVTTIANILAKEFSRMDITCNTLAISAFESDMLKQHSPIAREKIKKIIANLTIPRMAKSDDILNVVDFFASERSSYISGQTIYLGGIH